MPVPCIESLSHHGGHDSSLRPPDYRGQLLANRGDLNCGGLPPGKLFDRHLPSPDQIQGDHTHIVKDRKLHRHRQIFPGENLKNSRPVKNQGVMGHSSEKRQNFNGKKRIEIQASRAIGKLHTIDQMFGDRWDGATDWYSEVLTELSDSASNSNPRKNPYEITDIGKQLDDLENQLADLLPKELADIQLLLEAAGLVFLLLKKSQASDKSKKIALLGILASSIAACSAEPPPQGFTDAAACTDLTNHRVGENQMTGKWKCSLALTKEDLTYNFLTSGDTTLLIVWRKDHQTPESFSLSQGQDLYFVNGNKGYRFDPRALKVTEVKTGDAPQNRPRETKDTQNPQPEPGNKYANLRYPPSLPQNVMKWQGDIERISSQFDYDPRLVAIFMTIEDPLGDPVIVSRSGAVGLLQIMPTTFTGLVNTARLSPRFTGLAKSLGIDLSRPDARNSVHNIFFSMVYWETYTPIQHGLIPTGSPDFQDYKNKAQQGGIIYNQGSLAIGVSAEAQRYENMVGSMLDGLNSLK